jgi:hypothetical protein
MFKHNRAKTNKKYTSANKRSKGMLFIEFNAIFKNSLLKERLKY